MKKYAIVVAGGTGNRMQGNVPKQFMLLRGKPVMLYPIEAFYAYDPAIQIILVVHADYLEYWDELIRNFEIPVPVQIATGGKTRFDSVKSGLNLIEGDGIVAIHDAARPLIDADFVSALFTAATEHGSAIPAIPLNDTIRKIDGDISLQLDRSTLRAIQTPQVFSVLQLKQAYQQPYQPVFTDDASVLQSAGFQIFLTEGRADNIKITLQQDIALAEVLLK